jgi:serine/threonine protein phosphatase PrpC
MLEDIDIREIVIRQNELSNTCNELVTEALKRGGLDNITSLLISIESVENN